MNEFVSLYDVVFGTRPDKKVERKSGSLDKEYVPRPDEDPIDITRVICAIEEDGCDAYSFDEFGRFGVAREGCKSIVKEILKQHHKTLSFSPPDQVAEYNNQLSDFNHAPEWYSFGWLFDELPDFEESYKTWKSAHNTSGQEPDVTAQRLDNPRKSNTVWEVAKGLLKIVISDHLATEKQSVENIIADLISSKKTTETIRLLNKLQRLAPDSFTLDEKTFRIKLQEIFSK